MLAYINGGNVFLLLILLVFAAISFVLFGFWLWMLIDCIKNEKSEGNDKLIWLLVIIFTGWLGGLIYLFARKLPRRNGISG